VRSPSIVGLIVGFLVLAVIFGALERVRPAVRGFSIFRRERVVDGIYWFFTPLATRAVSELGVGVTVVLAAAALGFEGAGKERYERLAAYLHAHSPVARLPPAIQLLLALVLADLLAYGCHRAFHCKTLWRFHAVHHSAVVLDWLAATRVHPLNDLANKLVLTLPLLFLGFDPVIFVGVAPILAFWTIFEHANVPWGFGPLGYVIATPLFHRWHHTSEKEGLDKNFAGLFPFIDLIFGTFYLPSGKQPTRFGVTDGDVPTGFFGQLMYPFRRRSG
jgi:sterol desaturase/sphingolipid hydroxylase (fatty acid hydroxylase superfamily)